MFAGVYSIRPLFSEIVQARRRTSNTSERLKILSEEQRLLLEHTRDFIYRHDSGGIITYILLRRKDHRVSPEEWCAHYSSHYTDNEVNRAGIDYTNEMLTHRQGNGPYRVEVRHKAGGTVWLEINKQPYFNERQDRGRHRRCPGHHDAGRIGGGAREPDRGTPGCGQEHQDAARACCRSAPACKKIRDDKGYWQQIEAFVSEHSDAEFSHGLCPDCAVKLYPDHMKPRADPSGFENTSLIFPVLQTYPLPGPDRTLVPEHFFVYPQMNMTYRMQKARSVVLLNKALETQVLEQGSGLPVRRKLEIREGREENKTPSRKSSGRGSEEN